MINATTCCFSVKHAEEGHMRYAYGAGMHAGLTVVLNTQQLGYFAPMQPMTGIWVSCIQTVVLNNIK
jgi:hypothetical protein